ncbi:MAG: four-helix bundle copper-binding protein [Steroidobacter sp.]
MNTQQMVRTHPDVKGDFSALLIDCIDECFACAQSCTSCADACLAEPQVDQLRQCIRLNLDCADLCSAAGALASRRTGSNEEVLLRTLEVCQLACSKCAEECELHAKQHEHCRICAEACRRCEHACRMAMQDVGGASGRIQTN